MSEDLGHGPGARGAPMKAVWERNLSVLAFGQLVAVSGMGIVIPLIPFFLRELGMTDPAALERWSGLVFSGPFLAAALMSPVWGHLGDRYGHKKMVLRAIFGLAVVNLLLAFIGSPAQFFVIRVTQGLVTGFIPAALAITAASAPRERLPEAMGKLAASASAGRLLGPALGGLLAGFLAFRELFLLVAAMMAVVAVSVVLLLEEPPREASLTSRSAVEPLRRAMGHRELRLALPGLLAAMAGISMTMPIFPLYVERLCGSGPNPKIVTGFGFAVVAGFMMVGAALLGRVSERTGLKRLLVGSLVVAAVALVLHPLAAGIPAMLALRALLGIATAGVGPVLQSMISRSAPEGLRGGIMGLTSSAQILGFFVGPVAGGWLANLVGIDGVFRVGAGLTFACGLGAAILTRRLGRARDIARLPTEAPR